MSKREVPSGTISEGISVILDEISIKSGEYIFKFIDKSGKTLLKLENISCYSEFNDGVISVEKIKSALKRKLNMLDLSRTKTMSNQ